MSCGSCGTSLRILLGDCGADSLSELSFFERAPGASPLRSTCGSHPRHLISDRSLRMALLNIWAWNHPRPHYGFASVETTELKDKLRVSVYLPSWPDLAQGSVYPARTQILTRAFTKRIRLVYRQTAQ